MLSVLGLKKKALPVHGDLSAFEATNVSLSTLVPKPPRESVKDERVLRMLPIAKLTTAYGPTLCRIRSLSAGGVAAEASLAAEVGDEVQIEFNSLRRVQGRVVWVRPEAVGIKFDEAVDLAALLSNKPDKDGQLPRPPRLEISCGATVRFGTYVHQVEVKDISMGGVKVDINDSNIIGRDVVISIDSMRPLKGCVRWYRDRQAGILFDKPLEFKELTDWLGKRFELASARAGAWQGGRRRA